VKLADALKNAGVSVCEQPHAMTLAEARQLAVRAKGGQDPAVEHQNEALTHLPFQFATLKQSRKGEDFVRELKSILDDRRSTEEMYGLAGFEINRHTIFGLSQLVHERRDAHQGSRRKSFERLIPRFLEMKNVLEKNPSANALEVLEKHLR